MFNFKQAFISEVDKDFMSVGLIFRRHVKGHISIHLYLAALPETGAAVSGVGGCTAGFGTQASHDQGPAASGSQAPSQAAADPRGPSPSTPGPLQGHSHPQHLHVWGHERSVRCTKGPSNGQRADGDGA